MTAHAREGGLPSSRVLLARGPGPPFARLAQGPVGRKNRQRRAKLLTT